MKTSDWYFDIFIGVDSYTPSVIALSRDGHMLDDQLGSHNLPRNIINALNRAGIYGEAELMESVWEVIDSESKSEQDINDSMEKEGFIRVKLNRNEV